MKHRPQFVFALLLLPMAQQAQDSLNVQMICRWHNDTLPATWMYDNTYNACWGYARDGREYAIIGSTMGTHIIDVTGDVPCAEVAFVAGAVQGGDVVHREFKTYQDRLYAVTDEGPGTLQIIDLRYLPDSVEVNYDSGVLFHRAHSIWIDTANARLYTHYGSSQFAIWSLADPDAPTLLLKPELTVPWWNQVGGVHDAYTVNNICYTNDVDAMHIIDFTNVGAPVLLATLDEYPQPGYNHSGWLHDNGWLYVMADETHGTDLKLFDVSDPGDIQFIDTIGVEWHPLSIPHNPVFQGDLLHVAYYYDGYWLWNTSDPSNAQVIGYYDTSLEPHGMSYKGAWGVYPFLPSGHVVISDMQRGMFLLDITQAVAVQTPTANELMRIWPTITNGPLNISTTAEGSGTVTIDVLDISGKRMMHRESASGEQGLDLSDMADGLYLVRATFGDLVHAQRVIKTSVR